MDVYIKPLKKVTVIQKKKVCIKDIAQIAADPNTVKKIGNITIFEPALDKRKNYAVSVIEIIKNIQKTFPDYTVNNVGEMDTLVEYLPQKSSENPAWKWLKIIFVTIVLFVGSSTAIMSFHTDAQIPETFQNFYKIFFNKENNKPLIIYIPYSIGLAVGIITFFNHFAGKKINSDPTPIEVEMFTYDKDVTDTEIKSLTTTGDSNA